MVSKAIKAKGTNESSSKRVRMRKTPLRCIWSPLDVQGEGRKTFRMKPAPVSDEITLQSPTHSNGDYGERTGTGHEMMRGKFDMEFKVLQYREEH